MKTEDRNAVHEVNAQESIGALASKIAKCCRVKITVFTPALIFGDLHRINARLRLTGKSERGLLPVPRPSHGSPNELGEDAQKNRKILCA
jgi:hypothetical protein